MNRAPARVSRTISPRLLALPTLLVVLACGAQARAADFLQGDAAAPGMAVDVHIVRNTGGFTGFEKVTTSCSSIVSGPVIVRDGGTASTIKGAVLSTVFFVRDDAAAATCTLLINGTALAALGNFDNKFHIVTAANSPIDGGAGDADGTVNKIIVISSKARTDGGVIVFKSLDLPSGYTLKFDTVDPITGGGNEAFLPAIVRVAGSASIKGTIDVGGVDGTNSVNTKGGNGGNGGPGGGGGGAGAGCLGVTGQPGNGFSGGGGTKYNSSPANCSNQQSGGTGVVSVASSEHGGDGIFTTMANGSIGYAGGTGGAPGAIFGTSGGGGYCCGSSGAGGYGGAGGNGHATTNGGPGGGGWGTDGENGDGVVGGTNTSYAVGGAGKAHGRGSVVPLAGGSSGGGGDSGDGEGDGGGGGGGGGAFYLSAASIDATGAVFKASGGRGGNTTGDSSGSSTGGGGGSGGTVFLSARSWTGFASIGFDLRGGVAGIDRLGKQSGDGGEGRLRIDGATPGTLSPGPTGARASTYRGPAVLGISGTTLSTSSPSATVAYVYRNDGSLAGTLNVSADGSVDLGALLGYRWNYVALVMPGTDETLLGASATYALYVDPDEDGDDVDVEIDNCDDVANPDQADLDHDGEGDACDPDADGDGYDADAATGPDDCDDLDADVNPGEAEVPYDGIDQDCSGADLTDVDKDGYAGGSAGDDCNDNNASVHPGATEVCNGIDDNCDKVVDTDAVDRTTYYADRDDDGYGDPKSAVQACSPPTALYITTSGDCNDVNAAVHPGATEVCNGIDDDCDGTIDQNAADPSTFYADADGDGYGDPAASTKACQKPTGTVNDGTDCDDSSAAVNPGATEVCNGIDDDCDGVIDSDAVDRQTYYADTDSDGYGNGASATKACSQPAGYVTDATDCDDTTTAVNPGAAEACNGIDDDCDTTVDDGVQSRFLADVDQDGYGDNASAVQACAAPDGYVSDPGDAAQYDCDDAASEVHPGATELCNEIDDDCDEAVDEGVTTTYHPDADADGFGDEEESLEACAPPTGATTDGTDCDDASASTYPGAAEVCGDGIDQDCNDHDLGCSEADVDDDGYSELEGDCDDADPGTYPGAEDVPYDGIDQDCTDGDETDVDDDGYDGGSSGDDCDDEDPEIHPGAEEVDGDGKDNDCDGEIDPVETPTPTEAPTPGDDDTPEETPSATPEPGDDDTPGETATPGDDDTTTGDDDTTAPPDGDDDSSASGDDDSSPTGDDSGSGCTCSQRSSAAPQGPLFLAAGALLILFRRRR